MLKKLIPPFLFPAGLLGTPPKTIPVKPIIMHQVPAFLSPPNRPKYPPIPRRRYGLNNRLAEARQESVRRAYLKRKKGSVRPAQQSAPRHPVPFDSLDQEVSRLLGRGGTGLSEEDKILVKQMRALSHSRAFNRNLDDCRDLMERGIRDAPALIEAKERKNKEWREAREAKLARAKEKAKRKMGKPSVAATRKYDKRIIDGHQNCINSRRMSYRKDLHRGRLDKLWADPERLIAMRQEEVAHLQAVREAEVRRQEKARVEAERKAARLEQERRDALRRDEEARLIAEQAAARREDAARLMEERRRCEQAEQRRHFEKARRELEEAYLRTEQFNREKGLIHVYDGKWELLRSGSPVPVLYFWDVPWPLFDNANHPDDITLKALKPFFLHPLRMDKGKTQREHLKIEILKWHPDKFDAVVLPKIFRDHVELTQEAAGRVARILNQMMQEVEN